MIAVGISMVLLINRVKKKNEEIKPSEGEKTDKNKEDTEEDYMSTGMSLGMCFGVVIGSFFTNSIGPEAIFYGICFGMLIGMTVEKKQ